MKVDSSGERQEYKTSDCEKNKTTKALWLPKFQTHNIIIRIIKANHTEVVGQGLPRWAPGAISPWGQAFSLYNIKGSLYTTIFPHTSDTNNIFRVCIKWLFESIGIWSIATNKPLSSQSVAMTTAVHVQSPQSTINKPWIHIIWVNTHKRCEMILQDNHTFRKPNQAAKTQGDGWQTRRLRRLWKPSRK